MFTRSKRLSLLLSAFLALSLLSAILPAQAIGVDDTPATPVGAGWIAYEETNPFITWSKGWTKASSSKSSGGAVQVSSTKGATVTFAFSGDGIEWDGIKASSYGTAAIALDGVYQGTVDLKTTAAYYQQSLFHKEGLAANQSHTLMIKITSDAPAIVSIDRFMVHGGLAGAIDPAPKPATAVGNGWTPIEEYVSYVAFSSGWTRGASPKSSAGHISYTKTQGAKITFRFNGDGVEWVGIKAPSYGWANVTLDGVPQGTIDLRTRGTYYQQSLFHKEGLKLKQTHVLVITVKSPSPAIVALDRFMVHGGKGCAPNFAANDWTTYEENNSNFVYSNGWSRGTSSYCYGGAAQITQAAGSTFTCRFTGDAIEWEALTASTYGSADVYLDGTYQGRINLNASSTSYRYAAFYASGLKSGVIHTLTITSRVSGGKLICVDRIMVHTGKIVTPSTGTYVDVDISEQTLRYYVNGVVALTSPVVTGKPSTPTHTGTFKIAYKARNTYLTGPGYHAFVNYWMPFDGGIGLHDASWQSSFGGTRYLNGHGSHGCVNMPLDKARTLYGMVSAGTVVKVHQ